MDPQISTPTSQTYAFSHSPLLRILVPVASSSSSCSLSHRSSFNAAKSSFVTLPSHHRHHHHHRHHRHHHAVTILMKDGNVPDEDTQRFATENPAVLAASRKAAKAAKDALLHDDDDEDLPPLIPPVKYEYEPSWLESSDEEEEEIDYSHLGPGDESLYVRPWVEGMDPDWAEEQEQLQMKLKNALSEKQEASPSSISSPKSSSSPITQQSPATTIPTPAARYNSPESSVPSNKDKRPPAPPGKVNVRFTNTFNKEDVIVVADFNDNLLRLSDVVGVNIPRSCRTGLCGACTCDVIDVNYPDGRQTIRACSTQVRTPENMEELIVDVGRMSQMRRRSSADPFTRFQNLDTDYVQGAVPGMGNRNGPCKTCKGTGRIICYECHGVGVAPTDQSYTCSYCVGTGTLRCADCQGGGIR